MMDRKDVIWRLACLASLPYQERYVLNGSEELYVTESELIQDIEGIRYVLERPGGLGFLNSGQMQALRELFSYIQLHSAEALAGAQTKAEMEALIKDSQVWKGLRSKAESALKEFGVSVEMTIEDIEDLAR
jgi:hypothetical protein